MARGIEKLKALQVERLSKKPGLHNDGAGLCLRVRPPSASSWVLRYMLDGKPHEMGLGRYPDISLAEARIAASEARKLRARGEDPIEARDAQRSQQQAEAARSVTFRHCAKAYLAARSGEWKNAKHRAQWEATLETYAYPTIGSLPVASVDRTRDAAKVFAAMILQRLT